MRNKRILFLVAALAAITICAGCASIIHGSKQDILFETSPAGATVQVSDAKGVMYGPCETPCSLELQRKREYVVNFSKEGYNDAEFHIERKSDGWIWGNILFGGVIGIIIDFSNGSAYKLSPDQAHATLSESSTSGMLEAEGGDRLVFIDLESLTPEEQARIRTFESFPISLDWN
ncbi:MAG: PEGA domain-containing protein [bacterium]|nr:PEGA domain-containing protein [bacterium]